MRVVLDVPKEWIVLAAWLEVKGRMRTRGNFGSAGNIWWEMQVARLQKWHAKDYIWRLINNDMHEICTGCRWGHTGLPTRQRKASPRPSVLRVGHCQSLNHQRLTTTFRFSAKYLHE